MAIHFVDMIENTSPLMDELLSQRLGLIPLVSAQAEHKRYDWEGEGEAIGDNLTTTVHNEKLINRLYSLLNLKTLMMNHLRLLHWI